MLVNVNGQEVNLPDILILGAAKSGTTSLAFFLKQHPDVFMPRKEPGFFAYHNRSKEDIPSGIRDRQIVDLKEYTDMYAKVGSGQKICDSSVAQFTNHQFTIKNINDLYGERKNELKTFVILRNPVDRAFSHYQMFVKNQLEELEFNQAWDPDLVQKRRKEQLGFDYLGGSMYSVRIKEILSELPQTKVYITSDLKNPDFLHQFLAACDLRTDVDINTTARLNPSGIPTNRGLISALNHQNPVKSLMKKVLPGKTLFKLYALKSKLMEKGIQRIELDPASRSELIEKHFKADLLELESLINRDLSKWYTLPENSKV